MQQLVKQYIDSFPSRVISDEVKLSQLSQQCEPSTLLATNTPGTCLYQLSVSYFMLLILATNIVMWVNCAGVVCHINVTFSA